MLHKRILRPYGVAGLNTTEDFGHVHTNTPAGCMNEVLLSVVDCCRQLVTAGKVNMSKTR